MNDYAHAIDVSSHQDPDAVPYAELAANGVRAVWIRAAYGSRLDTAAVEHAKRARDAGIEPALYLFWRFLEADSPQLEALLRQHDACGIGPGSPSPWFDVEDDRDRRGNVICAISKAWLPRVEAFLRALRDEYGAAVLYAYESALDGPLAWPRWPTVVAHYRGDGEQRWPPCALTPAPGAAVVGHQYGVGPGATHRGVQQRVGAGVLDRDWVRWPPPRICDRPELPGPPPAVPLTEQQIAAQAALAAMEGIR